MAWKTLCEGVTIEEAVKVVGASLQKAEDRYNEYLKSLDSSNQVNSSASSQDNKNTLDSNS